MFPTLKNPSPFWQHRFEEWYDSPHVFLGNKSAWPVASWGTSRTSEKKTRTPSDKRLELTKMMGNPQGIYYSRVPNFQVKHVKLWKVFRFSNLPGFFIWSALNEDITRPTDPWCWGLLDLHQHQWSQHCSDTSVTYSSGSFDILKPSSWRFWFRLDDVRF